MILRQLFDTESSTYTYLIADETAGVAMLIDPVIDKTEQYLLLLKQLTLTLIVAVDTHTHADHITALGKLRDATGCDTMMGLQLKSRLPVSNLRSRRSTNRWRLTNQNNLYTGTH